MKRVICFLLTVSLILAGFIFASSTETVADDVKPPEVIPEPVVEPVVEEIPDYYPLTAEERELVWQTVYAEVRGCTCPNDECMVYVAQCIRDRVLVDGYGSTVTAVITAKNQFAYHGGEASEQLNNRIQTAIDKVFKDGYFAFDRPILHFHADWCTPWWVDSFDRLAETCGTYFYN